MILGEPGASEDTGSYSSWEAETPTLVTEGITVAPAITESLSQGGELTDGARMFEQSPSSSLGVSPKVREAMNTLKGIEQGGGKVQVNKLDPQNMQELNMTVKDADGSRLNMRVETHSLPANLGGTGPGNPVRHLNAEVQTSTGKTVKMPHIKGGHKIL